MPRTVCPQKQHGKRAPILADFLPFLLLHFPAHVPQSHGSPPNIHLHHRSGRPCMRHTAGMAICISWCIDSARIAMTTTGVSGYMGKKGLTKEAGFCMQTLIAPSIFFLKVSWNSRYSNDIEKQVGRDAIRCNKIILAKSIMVTLNVQIRGAYSISRPFSYLLCYTILPTLCC